MKPQCRDVLSWLQERGPLTPLVAQRELGVGRLAARVLELREMGYPIRAELVQKRTRAGRARVAEYRIG
jgi:hypothetical protein